MKIERKKNNIIFKSSKKINIKEISKTDSISSTFYSNNYSYTDYKQSLFLDYTFKGNKNKLYNEKNSVNLTKAKNYSFELEQTFKLNIDLLLSYYTNTNTNKTDKFITYNSTNTNNDKLINYNKEIILLLNKIKNKEALKTETKNSLKQKVNELLSKNDYLNTFHIKLDNQLNLYNIKVENKIKEIEQNNNYILELKERFLGVDKYIKKIRFNSEGRKGIQKKNLLKKFLNTNNKYNLKIANYLKDIKNIKYNISQLKKDNKLERSKYKLLKADKPDINLIRVVEFYLGIIRNLSLKNKILKNSIKSLSQTLEFLDLNPITNFVEYKRNRQKSSYEIEFSDLDDNNFEKFKKNNTKIGKITNFMDFNNILNKEFLLIYFYFKN